MSAQQTSSNPMVDLKQLPREHPLRNAPLAKIGAEYQWQQGSPWKPVFPSFRIAGSTFNSLGAVWTDGWNWRATAEVSARE